MNRIFAYGTLMNMEFLERRWGIKPVKAMEGAVRGRLYRAGWFPILIEDESEGSLVYGKVIEIFNLEEVIASIDRYEGCDNMDPNSLYFRKEKAVILNDGSRVKAWVYVGNPKNPIVKKYCTPKNLIKNGRWEPSTL